MTTGSDDGARPNGLSLDEGSGDMPEHNDAHLPLHSSTVGFQHPSSRPEMDKHFGPSKRERTRPKHPARSQHSHPQRAMRRMSSVPELRESNRGQSDSRRGPGYTTQSLRYRRKRSNPNMRQWSGSHDGGPNEFAPYDPYGMNGGNRLLRQKSIERGIVRGRTPPPPRSERSSSGGGIMTPRSRPGSLSGSSGRGAPGNARSSPTPEYMAFNHSVARGFTGSLPSSPQPPQQALPHNMMRLPYRPSPPHPATYPNDASTSAPDLSADYDLRPYNNRGFPYDPPRSHPYPRHPPFSAVSSANTSPHSSFAPPPDLDAIRGSFRSAISEVNRSSGFTTDSEAYCSEAYQSETYYTESSNAMTVDDAIGMYASDTDDEQENRRSHGDSVLGGATMRRDSSMEDSGYRSKGDSVLGGERSPMSMTRRDEQDELMEDEMNRKRISGDSVGRGNEADVEGDDSPTRERVLSPISPVREEFDFTQEEYVPPPNPPESLLLDGTAATPTPPQDFEAAVAISLPPEPPSPVQPSSGSRKAFSGTRPIEPRDRYGFKKGTQYISVQDFEKWEREYDRMLVKRREKWDKLLRDSGLVPGDDGPVRFPPKSRVVKRYIRKGIPPEWRGAAWFWYAGGYRYLNKHPGLYRELVERGAHAPDAELIERDLHRTFPDNIHFKADPLPDSRTSKPVETEKVQALRRVLRAFAIYAPRIGYCQSLNFLAGMLLLFMPEEKAFWMLYIMTHTHLPGTHQVNLEGSSIDQWVLMMSVRESLPFIWNKIGANLDGVEIELESTKLPAVTLCTSPWFMSGFIGSLPTESVLRVWDCLFYEGSKTLFRIALTIFKSGENQIRTIQDPMEIITTVQQIPRKFHDAGALIEACYKRRNGFGHLSQETVDDRRRIRRQVFAAERALAKRDPRASKDDFALNSPVTGGFNHGFNPSIRFGAQVPGSAPSPAELGRKWKKMLVKT